MVVAERVAAAAPEIGNLVVVRDRHWVVTDVAASSLPVDPLSDESGPQHAVDLLSVEDDDLNDALTVIWEVEPGARTLEAATLPVPVVGRFDEPSRLDAFLDAVRWGAVTSADASSLQAPFRSGITIEDYQLDPVVRALRMPRVNLLIADDVGLGKTIEAGLVVQELFLRHRARTALVVCPASLTLNWRAEMASKFGLDFEIVDAAMLRDLRRSRGVGTNPFRAFPRLIVSIDWLKRPRAMGLLRDVLPPDPNRYPRAFDLLVVDEVHQCAPAGRGRYARDSQRTDAIRALAPHFEHRLFLSATPHNGYTESFTALLELLDPQRFSRGVRPTEDQVRRAVVRRLKSQLREELPTRPDGTTRFPIRRIVPLEVEYPDEERQAHADLQRYAELRREGSAGPADRSASEFVTLLLKKRLFSSPEAFASTLDLHVGHMRAAGHNTTGGSGRAVQAAFERLDDEVDDEEELADATAEALATAARHGRAATPEEWQLLERLTAWSSAARGRPDAKATRLFEWLEATCTDVDDTGQRWWNRERVLVFTEYRDTQRWIRDLLIARGFPADRIGLLYGGMDPLERERIKAEFQHDPDLRPIRILLATDAASEGINLQRHCHRLVHVEIPFSPTRLEQRNGRIDRHGQPAPEVLIHHFVGSQWERAPVGSLEADLGFLSLIARKIDTIRDDLGSAGPVLAEQVERRMLGRPASADAGPPSDRTNAARALNRLERELRERVDRLRAELDESVAALGITPEAVERLVTTALAVANQPPLRPATLVRDDEVVGRVFEVPGLTGSWARATADLADPVSGQVLPISFDHAVAGEADDVVLAHLGHRLVAQSMRLLRAEIWSSGSATRLSRVTARIADVDEIGVVAHARLVVTGGEGHRLHEEVFTAGGRIAGGRFARWNVGQVREALAAATDEPVPPRAEARVVALWPAISDAMWQGVQARADERSAGVGRHLDQRRDADIAAISTVLEELGRSIESRLGELERGVQLQFELTDLSTDERAQWDRDVDAIRRRLSQIPGEILVETEGLRRRYADARPRVFPAAVTFLVPPGLAHR